MKDDTVWGGRLRKRFCNMFSESSTGSWAELQMPCCPSKKEELPENTLQNLLHNLPPKTVKGSCFENAFFWNSVYYFLSRLNNRK